MIHTSYKHTMDDLAFVHAHINHIGTIKELDLLAYITAYHEYDENACVAAYGSEYSRFYDTYSLWNTAILHCNKKKRTMIADVRYHVDWLRGNFGETEDKFADALINYFDGEPREPEFRECPRCLGTGMDSHDPRRPCDHCDGEGRVQI